MNSEPTSGLPACAGGCGCVGSYFRVRVVEPKGPSASPRSCTDCGCGIVGLSFFRSFVASLLRCFVPSFLRTFVPSLLRSFVPSFLRSFVPSFLRSFVPSLLHYFVPAFLRSFVSFVSFVPSFLRSFITSLLGYFDVMSPSRSVQLQTSTRNWCLVAPVVVYVQCVLWFSSNACAMRACLHPNFVLARIAIANICCFFLLLIVAYLLDYVPCCTVPRSNSSSAVFSPCVL